MIVMLVELADINQVFGRTPPLPYHGTVRFFDWCKSLQWWGYWSDNHQTTIDNTSI